MVEQVDKERQVAFTHTFFIEGEDEAPACGFEQKIAVLDAFGDALEGLGPADVVFGEKGFELGLRELRVNAAPDAVGFYEGCGWQRNSWAPDELTGIAADCVQMTKPLA